MGNTYNSESALEAFLSWPPANYINPVRRTWLPAFAIAWQALSTLLLAGRFYLRARKQAGSFGLDDLLIFFGWLFSVGVTTGVCFGSMRYGLDRHTWDLHITMYAGLALTGWLYQVLFTASSICTKLSVLLFYRRMMMETLDRRWVYALWAAIGFTICYGISVITSMLLFCQPIEALWRTYEPGGYDKEYSCFDGSKLTLASGVLGTVSDVYAVALPCLMLRGYDLDVPRRQKIALNIVFALGLLVSGCGIARTYYLWKANNSFDSSWIAFELAAWTVAECQLGLVCACAPSLRAFFRRYLRDNIRKTFGSAFGSSGHDRSAGSKQVSSGTTTTRRDTRSYIDLQDLDSSAFNRSAPLPDLESNTFNKSAPLTDLDEPDAVRTMTRQSEEDVIERFPTPTITSAEDFEAYAIARLSMISKHSYPALVHVRTSKTDGIVDSEQRYGGRAT